MCIAGFSLAEKIPKTASFAIKSTAIFQNKDCVNNRDFGKNIDNFSIGLLDFKINQLII